MDVMIVGNEGGTNVGVSLQRAALARGLSCHLCDARKATAGPRAAVTLSWRLLGHKPLRLASFSRSVVEECRQYAPKVLIATGLTPLDAESLAEIGKMGVRRVNYSTDDPWNPTHRSRWFLDAALQYDEVYSTRKANLEDFRRHGCRVVTWLPFGYDEELWDSADEGGTPAADGAQVFFAGAAEGYRIECIRALIAAGIRVAVAGDYWARTSDLRNHWVGHLTPGQLRARTRTAPLALCLVRRANRDGHVMRSFEIPAMGACMITEDTGEHRTIFGEDGSTVRYFGSAAEAVDLVSALLRDEVEARRLAGAAMHLVTSSQNTYADRLCTLIGGAGNRSRVQ
jgi:spore maturation protein CgeB